MFKGFLDGFSHIKDDLETIFSNSLNSNGNYYLKLALSDIHNLMIKFKQENKSVSSSML